VPSTDLTEPVKPEINIKPSSTPRNDDPPKPLVTNTPPRKPEPPAEKPKSEATKRKGKKGDGDN
jgi:hypothetical protein